jgi:hypothetical protein
MASWFFIENGEQRGPISSAELKSRADQGLLKPDDHVWQEGMASWVAAKQVGEFFSPIASPPPLPPKNSLPPAQSHKASPPSPGIAPKLDPLESLKSNPTVAKMLDPKNRLLVGYRAVLSIAALSVLLPWCRPTVEPISQDQATAAAAIGYVSINGLGLVWGVIALLAAAGGLLISFVGPAKLLKDNAKLCMAGFGATVLLAALIAVGAPGQYHLQTPRGMMPLAVDFVATAGIGAYIALFCGAASGLLGWINTWNGQ